MKTLSETDTINLEIAYCLQFCCEIYPKLKKKVTVWDLEYA